MIFGLPIKTSVPGGLSRVPGANFSLVCLSHFPISDHRRTSSTTQGSISSEAVLLFFRNSRQTRPFVTHHFKMGNSTPQSFSSPPPQLPDASRTSPPRLEDEPMLFDPQKPTEPISYPIDTLEDLEHRTYFDSFHYPFNQATVPLPPSSVQKKAKLLVCHDMMGGYTNDDRWIQGNKNGDAYSIWHWYLMDVFVYFSHHLVTLPPPCWTNAAHSHGVKVLGTFIAEWEEGRKVCNTLLATKISARMYAERLAELSQSLGFDGWLINLEVNLNPKQIPILKVFVTHLTDIMHLSVPGSLVIWYDAVGIDGSNIQQNKLNEKNKPFFDLCDGIFVNYSWMESDVKQSAAVAAERNFDVYMGIDVFGRSITPGGWNTNISLDLVKKNSVSAAIFAPGWIYENKESPNFHTAQNRWWNLVARSWGLVQKYPKILPFYSNFNQGVGLRVFVEGELISNSPWSNISCQSIQPVLAIDSYSGENAIQVLTDNNGSAYDGAQTISFAGRLHNNSYFMSLLFCGEIPLSEMPIYISYASACEIPPHLLTGITDKLRSNGRSLLGLALEFLSISNKKILVFLTPDGESFPNEADVTFNLSGVDESQRTFDKIEPLKVRSLKAQDNSTADWTYYECTIQMPGQILGNIYAVSYNGTSAMELDSTNYHASLGYISIRTSRGDTIFPPPTAWLFDSKYVSFSSSEGTKSISVMLFWRLRDSSSEEMRAYPKYNIYVRGSIGPPGDDSNVIKEKYIGVARVQAFYVSLLAVEANITGLEFILQVCASDGAVQKLSDAPVLRLAVPT